MLTAIVRFSIRFRGVVIALAFALLGYGIFSLFGASYDAFPDFAPPEASVQTEAPGLSPEQVEVLVTQPIENAINGVPGIASLRSRSIQGLSDITVIFDISTDVYRDRQMVSERLSTLTNALPEGIEPPIMAPLMSSTGNVMEVDFTSDTQSLMDVRSVADWTIKPRLLAVPGVSGIEIIGGEVRQLQIQVEPERLVQYGVSLEDVVAVAKQATGVRGGGFVDTPNQRVVLQTEGQSITPAELAATVLMHHKGTNVTLGDVAQVVDAPAPAFGAASVAGKRGVAIMVDAAYGSNTLEVTREVDAALNNLRPNLEAQGIVTHSNVLRAADFIQIAVRNVRNSLYVGAVLVAIVLFLFLFDLRTAAISCIAIPLSLLSAIIALEKMGLSLNTMTLGGLAIAIGEVVDDAVIDIENIYRRLRENRNSADPRAAFQVVLDASLEVRSAVVYATFAVILVFLPVLNMSGLAGSLFRPLAISYIWAILASLVVALTVTPALSLLFLQNRDLPAKEPPVVHWLKRGYVRFLARSEERPRTVMIVAGLLIVAGVATLFFLSSSFLPDLREGNITVHMTALPGTSLEESMRLGDRLTQLLLKIPYVQSVAQRSGRAEVATDTNGIHESEIDVNMQAINGAQVQASQDGIRNVLAQMPGAILTSNSFLTERINETLSGYGAAVVVNIFGNDLDQMDQEAAQIPHILATIPGGTEVSVESPPGMPEVQIRLRPENLARWGFDPVTVLDAVRTAYGSEIVGQTYEGNRVFDVTVRLAVPAGGPQLSEIGALPLRSPDGNFVTLRELADIQNTSGRYVILHEGARRVQTITCNVRGRNVNSFVQEAQRRIAQIKHPPGTYVEFSGTAAAQEQSNRELLINSLFAGLGMILLLTVVVGNARNLLLMLANLPFALVGGVFAAAITGVNLSLGSLIGFVTLFGITLRNSIMLISHYEHLVQTERMTWGVNAMLRGASERLAPILMTALVTGLGLLPLAIGSGDPGREIEGPMAIVILGGLATSTLLNLMLLPALALRYGKFQVAESASEPLER
jgi:CzcA family heavy metal efflux pump